MGAADVGGAGLEAESAGVDGGAGGMAVDDAGTEEAGAEETGVDELGANVGAGLETKETGRAEETGVAGAGAEEASVDGFGAGAFAGSAIGCGGACGCTCCGGC